MSRVVIAAVALLCVAATATQPVIVPYPSGGLAGSRGASRAQSASVTNHGIVRPSCCVLFLATSEFTEAAPNPHR